MSGGGGEGHGEASSGMGVLWIIVAVFVVMWGFWYFAHTEIIGAYFALKRVEIVMLQFFIGGLQSLKLYITHTPASQVDFQSLLSVANQVGEYLQIPVIIIVLLLAGILFFHGSAAQYSETYTMSSLVRKESENWPQNIPTFSVDLVRQDLSEGPWAMSPSPLAFAKKYHLLTVPEKRKRADQLASEARYSVAILRERANQIFILQLGRLWRGTGHLKPYMKALCAAFIARGAKDAEASNALLARLSRSSASTLDYTGVDELIEKYINLPEVQKLIGRHAYELTVMATLLEYARTDGVLSSSEFLWLKPIDRRLWFVLNTVGRRVVVSEVAGVYAHWAVETKLRRALKVPMIEQATTALDVAVKEMLYSTV